MSPIAWLSNVTNAVPSAYGLASTRETQALAGNPVTFLARFVHVLPPSRVSCRLPSSVPTHTTSPFIGDSQMVKIVQWFSALELSTDTPPDASCCCLAGSLVVRSPEMRSQ